MPAQCRTSLIGGRVRRRGWRAVALACGTWLALAGLSACQQQDAGASRAGARLAALPVGADAVTVSGFSAGGYMAVQFHVAHSSLVRGAGVFAAGPYLCAGRSLGDALGRCMKGDAAIATDELVGTTSQLALDEEIDPIAGLADDRVFLWHGDADAVVARPVTDALQAYYAMLVDPRGIERVDLHGAAHTFPADDAGLAPCGATQSPFIGDCGYDGARRMLEHLYGRFEPATSPTRPGTLREFDQRPYARAADAAGLAAKGWLYVPAACHGVGRPGRCRLHVVFHGCEQGGSYVQDVFVRRSGYLAAADAGDVVLLFPQVDPGLQPLNPNGCWDWWGYGSDAYATRRGPQVMAVKAMIDDLVGAAAGERSTE